MTGNGGGDKGKDGEKEEHDAAVAAASSSSSSGGVSNNFLQGVLQKYCSDFRGVYSCDQIPVRRLVKLKRYSIVCNLSPANHPGSHFVTVTVGDGGAVTLCDPLILPPQVSPDICNFLVAACMGAARAWGRRRRRRRRRGSDGQRPRSGRRRGEIRMVPARAVQHARSKFCGFFAMAYVLHFDGNVRGKRAGGLKFRPVTETSPPHVNEDLCLEYILTMLDATKPLAAAAAAAMT